MTKGISNKQPSRREIEDSIYNIQKKLKASDRRLKIYKLLQYIVENETLSLQSTIALKMIQSEVAKL